MGDGVQVNPQRLAELAQQLSDYAEQVVEHGRALTVLGRPDLGGTEPSYELVDGATTNISSTATWVMTSGSALRALAQAASAAAEAYRATEEEAAQRFAAMTAAFDTFDDMYGLMTDPENRVPAPDPYPPHYPSTAPDPR